MRPGWQHEAMSLADGQGGYRVRFDWGPVGADAVAPGAAFVAVVDVLSFTTTLTVAIEQGLHVLPYRWRDDSAVDVARRHGAMLAVLRKEAGPGQVTLSPESILHANLRAEGIDRLVLPSPNGSAISVRLAAGRGGGGRGWRCDPGGAGGRVGRGGGARALA